MKINPFTEVKEWLKHSGESQEKGFPVSVFILVPCFHPTQQLNKVKSVVVNLGPGLRANSEMARDSGKQILGLKMLKRYDIRFSTIFI